MQYNEVVPSWKNVHRNVFRDGVLCVPAKFYIGEDLIINIRLSNNVNRARLISYQGYYYREHEESTTHTCRVSLEFLGSICQNSDLFVDKK